jgi:hypothetical protein
MFDFQDFKESPLMLTMAAVIIGFVVVESLFFMARAWKRGKEIGMIRRMADMPKETQELLNEELDRRYFTPEILRITGMKEKFGYSYWDVDTTAGRVTFVLNNPFSNIRVLEDNSVFINDIDGNCFKIPDVAKLDAQSLRKIEIYL